MMGSLINIHTIMIINQFQELMNANKIKITKIIIEYVKFFDFNIILQ